MSFIDTPPSARAPRMASAARSTMSLSGCLPNFVMWIPRIQISSLALMSAPLHPTGSKPKPMASVPLSSVPSEYVASLTFIPVWTCSGSGSTLMMLPRTLVPSQSTTPDDERHLDARCGEGDDRERAQRALGADRHRRGSRCRSSRRRRCGGRRSGPRSWCTRSPRGAGCRPAPGSRRGGSALPYRNFLPWALGRRVKTTGAAAEQDNRCQAPPASAALPVGAVRPSTAVVRFGTDRGLLFGKTGTS